MLQVMKDGYHRAGTHEGRSETRIEKHIETMLADGIRQRDLLPHNSRGAKRCGQWLLRANEISLARNQIRASLAIGENDVLVHRIDLGERGKQVAKINFSAADSSRNQVEGVDTDTEHLLAEASQFFTHRAIPRIDCQSMPVLFGGLQLVALRGEDITAVHVGHPAEEGGIQLD